MAKQSRLARFFSNKKYRPLVIGGLVVIGVITLLALAGRRGGGASAGVATGPSEAMQARMIEAQLAGAQIQAGYAADTLKANVAMAEIAAAERTAALSHISDLEQIQATERLQTMAILAERELRGYETAAALEREIARENAAVRVAEIAGQTQQFLAQQAAAVQIGVVTADYQKEIARVQGQIAAMDIAYGAQRDIALAQEQTMQLAVSKAKKKHVASMFGGASPSGFSISIPGIGGLSISDVRAKENIRFTGESDGINYYEYEERNAFCKGVKRHGVMAQEVPAYFTGYVNKGRPYLGVDYPMLDASRDAIPDNVT